MNNDDEEEDDFPATIKETLDLCMASDEEFDLLVDLPENKTDWLNGNLNKKIIDLCDLHKNSKLRAACGSENLTANETADVIIQAILDYFNGDSGSYFDGREFRSKYQGPISKIR